MFHMFLTEDRLKWRNVCTFRMCDIERVFEKLLSLEALSVFLFTFKEPNYKKSLTWPLNLQLRGTKVKRGDF